MKNHGFHDWILVKELGDWMVPVCLMDSNKIYRTCQWKVVMEEAICILNVPLIAQKGTRLCWAATMEMVMRYIGCNDYKYQGELSENQFKIWSFDRLNPSEIKECDDSNENEIEAFFNKTHLAKWNQDLVYELNTQPWDTLFSLEKYYSVHDENIAGCHIPNFLSWELVVDQIKKQRRPFIVILGEYDEEGNNIYSATHSVVVRGFWTKNEDDRYLVVNDPLSYSKTNEGRCYLLNYKSLVSGEAALRIRAIAINIREKCNFESNLKRDPLSSSEGEETDPSTKDLLVVDDLAAIGILEVIAAAHGN